MFYTRVAPVPRSRPIPPLSPPPPSGRKAPAPSVFDDLPVLSPVLARLMQVLMQEEVSIIEVGTLVRSDVALSAQVLRLVNSPLYSLRREITGILEAISLVGLERVKVLSFTLAMQTYLISGLRAPVVRSAWRHNLATALIAEKLGANTSLSRDVVYTSGLFHEIGLLLLLSVYPKDGEQMLQRAEQSGHDLLDAEREAFGLDHYALGSLIVDRWQLPSHLKETMTPDCSSLKAAKLSVPALVHTSCCLANYFGFAVVAGPQPSSAQEILDRLPEASRYHFALDEPALTSELLSAINSIELSGM